MKGTHKLIWNVSTIIDVFLDQKRVNVCEHAVKTAPCESFGKVPPEWVRDRKRGGVTSLCTALSLLPPFCFIRPLELSQNAIFTVCSHTFTLFWSRKTSVIVETFHLSYCVPFIRRSLNFFGKNFLFLFLFFVLSILWYFPFHMVSSLFLFI